MKVKVEQLWRHAKGDYFVVRKIDGKDIHMEDIHSGNTRVTSVTALANHYELEKDA